MEEKKYNRSFATRLSLWVILVLLIMMGALSVLVYYLQESIVVELSALSFHGSMRSTEKSIINVMSNVSTAVDNNVADIERHLGQAAELRTIAQRIETQNPRISRCSINYDLKDVARDTAYWSRPFIDSIGTKAPTVAYRHPLRNNRAEVVATLEANLSLDFLPVLLTEQDSILEQEAWVVTDKSVGFHSSIILNDGTPLTHRDPRRIMKGNFFQHMKDYEEQGLAEKTVQAMKEGQTSQGETERVLLVNRKQTYLFYTPVIGTDWILTVVCPRTSIDYFAMATGLLVLVIISFVVLITFLVCYLTIKRGTRPLKLLATTADRVAQGQFDTPLPSLKHRDEICQLRDSFENMQHSLTEYVEELKSTTAAKASIENELKIAHDIQMSMLPKTYPAFPERTDIDIYGQVDPAKAVGGDLYDFFIRDERLFFCIGDVSGKGVPASLVMAVTRSLFRNIAAHTAEPQKMVTGINESLSSNNDTGMFVTLFVGALDLTTGQLDYSNAGHDIPLLIADGEVSVLDCDPNIPAGVLPGWSFTLQHIQLKTGDTLFLYTDGLNEAENANHGQFGLETIIQTARAASPRPEELIGAMTQAVEQFVNHAEQSDDLTMLAIQKK